MRARSRSDLRLSSVTGAFLSALGWTILPLGTEWFGRLPNAEGEKPVLQFHYETLSGKNVNNPHAMISISYEDE
jgi:hypothetical protein